MEWDASCQSYHFNYLKVSYRIASPQVHNPRSETPWRMLLWHWQSDQCPRMIMGQP